MIITSYRVISFTKIVSAPERPFWWTNQRNPTFVVRLEQSGVIKQNGKVQMWQECEKSLTSSSLDKQFVTPVIPGHEIHLPTKWDDCVSGVNYKRKKEISSLPLEQLASSSSGKNGTASTTERVKKAPALDAVVEEWWRREWESERMAERT